MTGIGLTGLHSYKNDGLPNRSYVSNLMENFWKCFSFFRRGTSCHKNAWTHGLKISLGIVI